MLLAVITTTTMLWLSLILLILTFSEVNLLQVSRHGSCQDHYDPVSTDTLEGLFVFIRHGHRAPWTTYPNDPHDLSVRWPNGRSQLTDLGIKQSRNLGRLLRNRYGDWITYLHSKKNHVLLRASAAQRCIDTLRHVASETFPSSSEYAIYSLPKPIDSVLWEEPYCPEADEEEKQNMLKSDVLEYENLPQIKELYEYVGEKTGLPATMEGVTKAFDCVRCDKEVGRKIPDWARAKQCYRRMEDVYTRSLNFRYTSTKSLRLRAGPMLQTLVNGIEAIQKNDTRRVHLYTTHDYKIVALLKALRQSVKKYPAFGGTLIFEVHRTEPGNTDFEIRAYYISDTSHSPYGVESIELDKCKATGDYHCTYSNFVANFSDFLNVSWCKECNITQSIDMIQLAENHLGEA